MNDFTDISDKLLDVEVGKSLFLLAKNGDVVQIQRCEAYLHNDTKRSEVGLCYTGEYPEDAKTDLFDALSETTQNALLNRLKEVAMNDYVATPDGDEMKITFNTLEAAADTIDNECHIDIDDYEDMSFDDIFDNVKYELGLYNDYDIFYVCEKNNIDISDIILIDELKFDDCVAVVAIENELVKNFFGQEIKDWSNDQKTFYLKEQVDFFEQCHNNEVYDLYVFNKDGDLIERDYNRVGAENVDLETLRYPRELDIVKELGVYDDIADCLYENRRELKEFNQSHDER